jgi:HTH-type transcriptional regulator/antitoxin HigA
LNRKDKDSRALIGVIGQRTRVYEVLRGKRSLSMNMIRELHDKFGIPANVLIQPRTRRENPQDVARRAVSSIGG